MNRAHSVLFAAMALIAAAGCGKKKRSLEAEPEPAAAASAAASAQSSIERFPADPAVLGSKSYPLKTITTANLSGRTKEGAANTWPFTLIDARSRVEFENEHIAGAVNVPAEKVEATLASVVQDKSRQIVFYCNGPACTKSHKAGRSATANGFPNAVVYDEGMPAWKEAKLPVEGNPLPQVDLVKIAPAALNTALQSKSMVVVDIRPRDEFLVFRIKGSINIELDQLEARLKDEVKPTQAICLADYTGHQQKVAVRLLAKLGYTNVKGLDEGLRGWQSANLPVEKGLEAAAAAGSAKPAESAKPVAKAGAH